MVRDPHDVLMELRQDPRFLSCITAWHRMEASEGEYLDLPDDLNPDLRRALEKKGIDRLYVHQRQAYDALSHGRSVCVVTPTASGKTLCYNLPVVDSLLKDPGKRALYIFPTKALSQDQLAELDDLAKKGGFSLKSFTFDGDTPTHKRRLAKEVGQIIITNPDMLHQALLPHHPTWVRLFSALEYVVIDEMHGYRGVFGSHVANVLRRLRRIASFYGTDPKFVLASATIANPQELANSLTGKEVALIERSTAPVSQKEFVFYNPPPLNADGSARQSVLDASSKIASKFIGAGVQTIVFTRSRLSVEILIQYLRSMYKERFQKDRIQGYRGGYLPKERRAVETKLRSGEILGVAATNALELGIDIGHLGCAILSGYPGTVASTWQQAGRAGRRTGNSVAILVAGGSPLDQFIVKNPQYFFEQSPEYALINPDNPYILGEHVKCAAYELPFRSTEDSPPTFMGLDVRNVLEHLKEEGILHYASGRWNWSSQSFPAAGVSLRSASSDNFVVIDTTQGSEVIGEVDWPSAPMLIHDEAIYIHAGQQYHVMHLDYEAKKAYVKKVDVDYYTDANLAVNVKVINVDKKSEGFLSPRFGEVSVTALATIFKKIKLYTHENVGSGQIDIPEMNLHTQGAWFTLPEIVVKSMDPRIVGAVLSGLANLILNIAPLFVMSDKSDLGVAVEVRSSHDGKPTLYVYDSYPGGVGLAEKVFTLMPEILKACLSLLESCECQDGCPGCVGPAKEEAEGVKGVIMKVLAQSVDGESLYADG